jgi:hypothetical protein
LNLPSFFNPGCYQLVRLNETIGYSAEDSDLITNFQFFDFVGNLIFGWSPSDPSRVHGPQLMPGAQQEPVLHERSVFCHRDLFLLTHTRLAQASAVEFTQQQDDFLGFMSLLFAYLREFGFH